MNCDILNLDRLGEFRRDYYDRNRPVVIRGVAASAHYEVFDWSASYLERVLGDRVVPVIETQSGFLSFERDMRRMPYREFVSRTFGQGRDQDRYYYFMNSTKLLPPGHDDSARIPVLGDYLGKALRHLWISRAGVTVGLHFDHAENFNFCLRGEKIFDLYPPGVRPYYPMPMFSQTAHISRVFRTGLHPDLTAFPRFDPESVTRVRLRQGDILYLPAYWWHQVQSVGEENVNLNFWWFPEARKQLLNANQALRGYYQLLSRYLKHGTLLGAPAEKAA